MKEDKIKEIVAVTIEQHTTRRNVKPSELGDNIAYQSPVLTIANDIAKQIADLYKAPEEVPLTPFGLSLLCDEKEIKEAVYDKEWTKKAKVGWTKEVTPRDYKVAKAQLAKARLYYEPKGDEEGLLTQEERNKAIDNVDINTCGDERIALCKAQKRLDDKRHQTRIKKLEDEHEDDEDIIATYQEWNTELEEEKTLLIEQHQKEVQELEKSNAEYQEDCVELARQLVEADEKIEGIVEYIVDMYVGPTANFYMSDANKERAFELWAKVKKVALKANFKRVEEL